MRALFKSLMCIVAVTSLGLASIGCDEAQPVAIPTGPTELDSFNSLYQQMMSHVELLVDDGKLTADEGESLCGELEAASTLFAQGDVVGAEAKVHAFQNQVTNFMVSGTLSGGDCTCLIYDAEKLIECMRRFGS